MLNNQYIFNSFLIIIFSLICCTGFSQSLNVNTAFGNNGVVTANGGNDAIMRNEVFATQPDGKFLFGTPGLLRTFPDGTIDSSFGTKGFANMREVNSNVNSIAVQADGKIIVSTIYNNYGYYGINCIRFSNDGIIDSTYNGNGIYSLNINQKNINYNKIAIQQDGKLVIVATVDSANRKNIFVARLLINGMPDSSFSSDGKEEIYLTAGDNSIGTVAFQSDGSLILTGIAKNTDTSSTKVFAIRLLQNGERDMSFNNSGIYDFISPSQTGIPSSRIVSVLPNDKILLASSSNGKILITKLKANGAIDSSFNGIGFVYSEIGGSNIPFQLHQLAAEKILVTGVTAFNGNENVFDFATYQFLEDGSPDLSFNNSGKNFIPLEGTEFCNGSAVLSDGRIILGGYRNLLWLIHLVRFNVNGTADSTFGNNGVKYLLAKQTAASIIKQLTQPDGKIICLIHKQQGLLNKSSVVIARYNTDGALDNSFGLNGLFTHPDDSITLSSAIQQPDGKLIVSVSKITIIPDYISALGIFRLNTDGTIDTSFASTAGNLVFTEYISEQGGDNLTLQPDGKILIISNHQTLPNEPLVVLRFNNNGTQDNSFGVNGLQIVPADNDSTINYFESCTLQNDGKILIAGDKEYPDNHLNFFVVRLLNDGSIDYNFANDGFFSESFPETQSVERVSIYQRPDSKIVLTGTAHISSYYDAVVAMARLDKDGNLDSSFNDIGIGYYKYPDTAITYTNLSASVMNNDSSFYIAGIFGNNNSIQSKYIIRIKNDGSLDSTLSSDGTGWHASKNHNEYFNIYAMSAATNGSIYIGGEVYNFQNSNYQISAFTKTPSGRLYTFTGNGSWTDPSNWSYRIIPPGTLPAGNVILIDPSSGGSCNLNVNQHFSKGSSITVKSGAKLIIQGGLLISD